MSRNRQTRPDDKFPRLGKSFKVSQSTRQLPCPECGEPTDNAPAVCKECADEKVI